MKLHRCHPMFLVWLAMVIALLGFDFSASAASPAFLFNSFGPGTAYNSSSSWIVGGSATAHGLQAHAEYFVPAFSGYLSQIQLGTRLLGGGDALSDFSIAQDNGSGIPGTILESFSNVTNPNGLLTLNSVTTPLLQAGQKYWLCDEPVDANSFVGWCLNSQGLTNGYVAETTLSGGSWFVVPTSTVADGVFSISVIPVPEPGTVGLVFVGVGVVGVRRWRSIFDF